jgi:predicted AAA+ superfamily ATPase
MKRIYESILHDHFTHYTQMAFAAGPRQVGKSTLAKAYCTRALHAKYLNWDKIKDRELILSGQESVAALLPADARLKPKPLIVFDEIHKYKKWKNFLKGFIDEYKETLEILVTGSAKLNIFQRGGDSLAGRYFLYRIHPFSVAELIRTTLPEKVIHSPQQIEQNQFNALFEFGGFPEPLQRQEKRFFNRWQELRQQQILREDIRELAQIQELSQLEVLASLLSQQTGQLTSYSTLAKKVRVSDSTIRRWINVLESFYYCFTIKPWSKNISRTLLKEPKIYLWDWSVIENKGSRVENFVASHLLKACHGWTDLGFGKFELYFLRDKEKHEVDFLLTKDQKPWILLEVKSSYKETLSKHLYHFQSQVKAEYVFQLAFDLPYIDEDCFALKKINIVPMITFLSQLF